MNRDSDYMRVALGLATRGLGQVWPNPAVGAILATAEGQIIARGWTQPGGRPHAEAVALSKAHGRTRGSTCYVSLEPCSHYGQTPPCADQLVDAGVARVVIGCADPDARVSGRGVARLRAAGISVTEDVCVAEARSVNAGFLSRIERGRPHVALKIASTLDGRAATRSGDSQWITGREARAHGHMLRARSDAIIIGVATAMADDPMLTCRLPGLTKRSPLRIVLDRSLRLPIGARLVATSDSLPTWVLTAPEHDARKAERLAQAGVRVLPVPDFESDDGLAACLRTLGKEGLTRVLVESGGRLAASLARAGLIDQLHWYRAPTLLGGDAKPAVGDLEAADLTALFRFERRMTRILGQDIVETFDAAH